jgi:hypothetical protein
VRIHTIIQKEKAKKTKDTPSFWGVGKHGINKTKGKETSCDAESIWSLIIQFFFKKSRIQDERYQSEQEGLEQCAC